MRAIAVIGANFGDEGKGHIVDYLCSVSRDCVVVRSSGGAQAGHTVVTPEGERHVFGHVGSGSLLNKHTHLSRYFTFNPLVLVKEVATLNREVSISGDPNGIVTTPFDMIVNQLNESLRSDKNTTCGLGLNETYQRSKTPYKLEVKDLVDEHVINRKLCLIRDHWIPMRLEQLGIDKTRTGRYGELLQSYAVIDDFIKMSEKAMNIVRIVSDRGLKLLGETFIMENGQGLLLDMDHRFYPYVTPSNTGLNNPAHLALMLNAQLEAVYVTRCYVTRHGAGPLPFEEELPFPTDDDTNYENKFQGELRFGLLSLSSLKARIEADTSTVSPIKTTLAVTCLDQPTSNIPYLKSNQRYYKCVDCFNVDIRGLGFDSHLFSYGKTRDDIVEG